MKVIRVALNGASGRMGHEIAKLAKEKKSYFICASLDERITVADFESYTRMEVLHQKSVGVVIDFSSPAGTMKMIHWCLAHKKPIVIGTTGFKESELKKIHAAAKKIPVFLSPNMSLGILGLREAMEAFMKSYGPCEVEFEEIHHKDKKDKPSGTALLLKETAEESKKSGQKIGFPVSLRGGEVYGIHKVYFFGSGEWLSFEHHAQGREVFAEGALEAGRWVSGQKPGLYSMKDLLKK